MSLKALSSTFKICWQNFHPELHWNFTVFYSQSEEWNWCYSVSPERVSSQDRGSETDATARICVCTKSGKRNKCSECVPSSTEAVKLMLQQGSACVPSQEKGVSVLSVYQVWQRQWNWCYSKCSECVWSEDRVSAFDCMCVCVCMCVYEQHCRS